MPLIPRIQGGRAGPVTFPSPVGEVVGGMVVTTCVVAGVVKKGNGLVVPVMPGRVVGRVVTVVVGIVVTVVVLTVVGIVVTVVVG
ncbi:MAG: hypothetical protein GKC06_02250, partial [Methanomicrobiales archaeon]|nr:hypothetical protein [Methanomicrobiales archaeon]